MGRSPCCSKEGVNRGAWTAIEDKILRDYIKLHGEGRWRNLPKKAGLKRCGKSCRLRWLNYLRPDIKRGNITHDEEELIIRLHKLLGNRWSLIAGRLPGRTDNEIKNYWNTKIGKKMQGNQSSSPIRKQSNDNNTKKHADKQVSTEVVTPSLPKMMQPHVVHTKARRCTKTFISPQAPHKLDHTNYQGAAGPSIIRGPSVDKPAEHGSYNGLSLIATGEDNGSDFMMDLHMGDLSLSDLLNSDFSNMCDFNYSNGNSDELSPASDQHIMFSGEMLEDWTLSDGAHPNVNSFSSFLDSGGDWLRE